MSTAVIPINKFADQPPAMQPVLAAKVFIANILPIPWGVPRSYGTILIAECPEGEPFALTAIESCIDIVDVGDSKKRREPVFAADIAADVVRHCNSDAGDGSDLGVFICGPNGPTKQQLAEANARVDAFGQRLVQQADIEWGRSKSVQNISDRARFFCNRFNLERDWMGTIQEMELCPGCGSRIRLGVAVCRECNAILDREKAIALGIAVPPLPESVEKPKKTA